MENTVSFQTAVLLKEAGFPQPDFGQGQIWYLGEHARPDFALFIYLVDQNWIGFAEIGGGKYTFSEAIKDWQKERHVFAPTATDILEQLQNGADLVVTNAKDGTKTYLCYYAELKHVTAKNPHEVAALAYLEIKKK